ncbi:Origin recognition complex, subunit 1 [Terramyces sp. JEL0728]|nr:Origin recognition complex, subunit 1 [Terramyces sp. JEL0728]
MSDSEVEEITLLEPLNSPPKKTDKRKTRASIGNFTTNYKSFSFRDKVYSIGECLYIESDEAVNEPNLIRVTEIKTVEEGEPIINGVWLRSWYEKEKFGTKIKTLKEYLGVQRDEVILTTEDDPIIPDTIVGKCKVVAKEEFDQKFPKGFTTNKSGLYAANGDERYYYCYRKCVSLTKKRFEQVDWNSSLAGAAAIYPKVEKTKTKRPLETSKPIKKVKSGNDPHQKVNREVESEISESESEMEQDSDDFNDAGNVSESDEGSGEESEQDIPSEPESEDLPKKRVAKIKVLKKKIQGKARVIRKRIAPVSLSSRSVSKYSNGDTFQKASERLHVSAVPDVLPCRENEFDELYTHVISAIEDCSGSCIYISGVPGTGKTATVKAVIRSLQESAKNEDINDFDFIEINGMKLTEPKQAYSILWKGLTGNQVSPTHAENLLLTRFKTPSPKRQTCVVLMDELDLLVTKKQTVVYNFFDWPNLAHSRLIVIAVANTMDLPERMLSNKVSSRLGLTRMTFHPYKHTQLIEIVKSRLEGLETFSPKAVEFCARKVGSVSGDARRCLDICRRAVEIFMETRDGNEVNETHIDLAIKEMFNSAAIHSVQLCSQQQRLFLVSCIKEYRKTGQEELQFGNIVEEHHILCQTFNFKPPNTTMLCNLCTLLGMSQLLLIEKPKIGDPSQKIKLSVCEQDVFSGIKKSGDERLIKVIDRMQ